MLFWVLSFVIDEDSGIPDIYGVCTSGVERWLVGEYYCTAMLGKHLVRSTYLVNSRVGTSFIYYGGGA